MERMAQQLSTVMTLTLQSTIIIEMSKEEHDHLGKEEEQHQKKPSTT